ncbi:MAG: rod shape-determining protein MreD [Syntrophomonadaceae bacterium]|nr:rod shape-determining protein MreD [Syntrophomonadaceae bacterium]
MRYLVLIILPFISIFLQTTVFSFLSMKGIIPDMVLIFVVFFALLNGSKNAAIYGFLCGLLEDLYMGRFIGINALSKGITGYVIGMLEGRVFKENLFVGIISVVIGTFTNSLCLIILSLISYNIFHLDINIFASIGYQTLYNVFLAIPIYAWYYHSTKRGVLRANGER